MNKCEHMVFRDGWPYTCRKPAKFEAERESSPGSYILRTMSLCGVHVKAKQYQNRRSREQR